MSFKFPGAHRSRLTALALTTVTVLSACGAGSTSAEVPEDVASAEVSEDELVAVSVMRALNTGFEPVVLTEQQGFFEDQGLDVTLVEASADTSAGIPRLLNGEVQFVNGGGPQAIKAVANRVDVRLITGIQSSVAGAAPTDGLLVPPGSSITSFKDLEGKKIGTPGLQGTVDLVNNIVARESGADPSTYNYVNIAPAALQEAAETGQVDAVLIFGLFYIQALESGFTALSDGTAELPGTLQVGYLTSNDYLTEQPDIVAKFNAAVAQGIEYANENPEAVRDTQREYTQLPDDFIDSMEPITYTAELDAATIGELATELVTVGAIDSAPSEEDLFWSEAPLQ